MTLANSMAAALDPVRFTQGLGFDPEAWQERLLRTQEARVLVLCARQVGKTTATAYKALHAAMFNPGRDVLIVSPSQRQSDEMLRRVGVFVSGDEGGAEAVEVEYLGDGSGEQLSRCVSAGVGGRYPWFRWCEAADPR
jgi:hypothetical protein